MTELDIACIHINYRLGEDGDMLTDVDVTGDIPIVTQLGLLELAKDSILIGIGDDE